MSNQPDEFEEWGPDAPWFYWYMHIFNFSFMFAFISICCCIMLEWPMKKIPAIKIPFHRYVTFSLLYPILIFCSIANADAYNEDWGVGSPKSFKENCGTEGNMINSLRSTMFIFTFLQIGSATFMGPPVRCYKNAGFGDWRGPMICNVFIFLFSICLFGFLDSIRSNCDLGNPDIGRSYGSLLTYMLLNYLLIMWRFGVYFYYGWDENKIEAYWYAGVIPSQHPGYNPETQTIDLDYTGKKSGFAGETSNNDEMIIGDL